MSENDFFNRCVGSNDDACKEMLASLGVDFDTLLEEILPENLPRCPELDLPRLGEAEAIQTIKGYAQSNTPLRPLLGMGFLRSVMPSAVRRHILGHAGWYTSYTPYQAEISQGRLEALLNFQHLICDLSGMDVANASLLDEASAAGEAMLMAGRLNRGSTFVVDQDLHPACKNVLATRAAPLGITLVEKNFEAMVTESLPDDICALLTTQMDTWGRVRDLTPLIKKGHQQKALLIVHCDPLGLMYQCSPGSMEADIVFGTSQVFGLPMGYGGPHAAFIACSNKNVRALPGRIVGVSKDRNGNQAYRLSLQTREQHIRRDRATSNICTAQSLPAILASMYAVYHGFSSMQAIAARVHGYAKSFAANMQTKHGLVPYSQHFLQTITLHDQSKGGVKAKELWTRAHKGGFALRHTPLADGTALLSATFDEAFHASEWQKLTVALFDQEESQPAPCPPAWPKSWLRQDEPLQHPNFTKYHAETAFMRYARRLVDRDLALDRTMIPLGSCTMKLNPSITMDTLQLGGLNDIHPYSDPADLPGYAQLIKDLSHDLALLTGFDQISLQPNAGSQGELAGLLAIRRYYQDHDEKRHLCLIPNSAHGTNPASAKAAGMDVRIIRCRDDGQTDLEHLETVLKREGKHVAALMLTYPSTHGIFDENLASVIAAIKNIGGQIYMDGANLNAVLGLLRPADLGADVCHMNLHKTFAIPHGGGGPGIGPIGVRSHLAKYLPGDPLKSDSGALCASQYGSASLLGISWLYIRALGFHGLRESSKRALLNANYIAESLADLYPITYRGAKGRLAHECILDCRALQKDTGVRVEDIAKRLIDYKIHAPTMSWPVIETLMVEPTEAENKETLDYFIGAMRAIHQEISEIDKGIWPKSDNPLVNAPHVMADLLKEDWAHPYSRQVAFQPSILDKDLKPRVVERIEYLSPVARLDQAYGDRNLFCSCPPLETVD